MLHFVVFLDGFFGTVSSLPDSAPRRLILPRLNERQAEEHQDHGRPDPRRMPFTKNHNPPKDAAGGNDIATLRSEYGAGFVNQPDQA